MVEAKLLAPNLIAISGLNALGLAVNQRTNPISNERGMEGIDFIGSDKTGLWQCATFQISLINSDGVHMPWIRSHGEAYKVAILVRR